MTTGYEVIPAVEVVEVGLGILSREVVLPSLVWRDPVTDWTRKKDDTVTVRLPAYVNSRKRTLRSGSGRSKDKLHERAVDVSLTTDLYSDIEISDEELSLDIVDFGIQVMNPVMSAIVRGYEDEVADLMTGASYEVEIDFDENDPHGSLVDAGTALNNANVPRSGRGFVCGSDIEAAIVKSDQARRFDSTGQPPTALTDATVSRFGGFNIVGSNALAPSEAYAFHRSAYVLSARAPRVPDGAPWGAVQMSNGFAIRTVQIMDPDEVTDRFIADAWVGTNIVQDHGELDENGKFIPADEPDNEAGSDLIFVRAVKLTLGS